MDMMDWMDTISGYASQGVDNFKRNLASFGNMSLKEWIRIITIIGAYLLIRPYLVKGGAKMQGAQHEKEIDPDEVAAAKAARAPISANSLRGQVQLPEDSESEDEAAEGEASGANWGKKARRRQRAMIRRIIEADEKLRRETQVSDDDDDADIEQYLT